MSGSSRNAPATLTGRASVAEIDNLIKQGLAIKKEFDATPNSDARRLDELATRFDQDVHAPATTLVFNSRHARIPRDDQQRYENLEAAMTEMAEAIQARRPTEFDDDNNPLPRAVPGASRRKTRRRRVRRARKTRSVSKK